MGKRVGVTFRVLEKALPYARALELVGVEPVLISPDQPRSLDGLDGLLLSGGTDVDPARYGAERCEEGDQPDTERDAMEAELLHQALDRDLPVLAICRGMQLFNVAHGGTLNQHLENHAAHRVRGKDPSIPVHEVTVKPRTRLAEILGGGACSVNSRHHQAVELVGHGLVVSAVSSGDGVIEGLERSDKRFAVAVEWHPEDQVGVDARQRKLFEAFRDALE